MGVNKAILIGNLGKDPELRYTPGQQAVATFSLATTERFNDKSGQRQDRTEWHNIVAWGKLAELAHNYLKKGRSVYVEGRITNRSWDDKDGNKRYRTEIVATSIQFLGSGSTGSSQGNADSIPMPDSSYAPSNFDSMGSVSEPMSQPIGEDDLPF